MKRCAIVHIGLEKTGTTALQAWLASHHPDLLDNGILMPWSIGFPNHTQLVAACLDEGVVDNLKQYYLFKTGYSEAQFRRLTFAKLDRNIRSINSRWHCLLITSELISSRLSSHAEIDRLLNLILAYVDHVRFVIFLRRQDRLALSRFSSILRSGYGGFDSIYQDFSYRSFFCVSDQRTISDRIFFYDFERILGRFSGLSGASLDVYLYNPSYPIPVFAELLDLTLPPTRQINMRLNESMSAHAQHIIANLNSSYPVQFLSGMRNEKYRRLQRRIEQDVQGLPRTVSRVSAISFLNQFEVVNRRVADHYPGLKGLCLSDCDEYPDFVDYSSLSALLAEQVAIYHQMARGIPVEETPWQMLRYKYRQARARLMMGSSTAIKSPPP